MKIEFDQVADALYVQLTDGDIEKSEEIKPGMILDYDANGNVLGKVKGCPIPFYLACFYRFL